MHKLVNFSAGEVIASGLEKAIFVGLQVFSEKRFLIHSLYLSRIHVQRVAQNCFSAMLLT